MAQHADYLLLRQFVLAQPGRVQTAGADAHGGGVRGSRRRGVLSEGEGEGEGTGKQRAWRRKRRG